jgi:hypothetical protein
MPLALQSTVRELTGVLLREIDSAEGSRIVEVLPEQRNAHVNRYLLTYDAPRLRLVTLKKCGQTWWYFTVHDLYSTHNKNKKETHG